MHIKTAVKTVAVAAGIGAAVALATPAAAYGPPGPPPLAELPAHAGYGPPPQPGFLTPDRYADIVCMDCGAVWTAPLAPPALLAGD